MDYCFSSICPNDLLNNMSGANGHEAKKQHAAGSSIASSSQSSCSSSPSMHEHSLKHQLQQQHQHSHHQQQHDALDQFAVYPVEGGHADFDGTGHTQLHQSHHGHHHNHNQHQQPQHHHHQQGSAFSHVTSNPVELRLAHSFSGSSGSDLTPPSLSSSASSLSQYTAAPVRYMSLASSELDPLSASSSSTASSSISPSCSSLSSPSPQHLEYATDVASTFNANHAHHQHQLHQQQPQVISIIPNHHHHVIKMVATGAKSATAGAHQHHPVMSSGSSHATLATPIMMLSSAGELRQQHQQTTPILLMDTAQPVTLTTVSGKQKGVKGPKKSAKNISSMSIVMAGGNNSGSMSGVGVTKAAKQPYQPPSPPSSSDTESDHSTSSSTGSSTTGINGVELPQQQQQQPTAMVTHTLVTLPVTSSGKANKLNNGIKLNKLMKNSGGTVIKQLRHQPYSLKVKKKSLKNAVAAAAAAAAMNNNMSGHIVNRSDSIDMNEMSSSFKYEDSDSINLNNLNCSGNSDDDCWPFFCSLSKLPTSGPLLLTEEEKRTLVQEGHQVPAQLPLSKSEEKILKKIRRKIKNKISAQESRRKKKEYVDSLERRMESYVNENRELKRRLDDLELNNRSLLSQLQKMKDSLLSSSGSKDTTSASPSAGCGVDRSHHSLVPMFDPMTSSALVDNAHNMNSQFGTLLMVIMLFFTVVLGVCSPIVSKDQLAHSATAAVTAVASAGLNRHAGSSSSASAATTAAVAVAAAAASFASTTIKRESLSPRPQSDECAADKSMDCGSDNCEAAASSSSAVSSPLGTVVSLVASNLDKSGGSLLNNAAAAAAAAAVMARSKSGTTVELTKVRPFIRKLPNGAATIQKTGQYLPTSADYPVLSGADESGHAAGPVNATGSQVIIVNLGGSGSSSPASANSANLAGGLAKAGSYRVVTTTSTTAAAAANATNHLAGTTAGSGGKIQTRFRVINSSSGGLAGSGSSTSGSLVAPPSILKINSV